MCVCVVRLRQYEYAARGGVPHYIPPITFYVIHIRLNVPLRFTRFTRFTCYYITCY